MNCYGIISLTPPNSKQPVSMARKVLLLLCLSIMEMLSLLLNILFGLLTPSQLFAIGVTLLGFVITVAIAFTTRSIAKRVEQRVRLTHLSDMMLVVSKVG